MDRMKRRLLLGAAIESVLTTSCGTDIFDVYLVNPARSPCEWTFITARSSRTVIRIRCMPRSAEGAATKIRTLGKENLRDALLEVFCPGRSRRPLAHRS